MNIDLSQLAGQVVAAPMAGVTDLPFRKVCSRFGAALTVSEMVHADPGLRHNLKARFRSDHRDEPAPVIAQLVGTEPEELADAARYNLDRGADIIDINMGCPARKVCNKQAGSALLGDETRVARIMETVVEAVDAPVTVKIRTGTDPTRRNGVRIACIAEQSGIQAVTVHGRTRACKFKGKAEYDTIREIKRAVCIPIIANGDIDSPVKARMVLKYTGADAVMIGRAAQGRPWLFGQVRDYLAGKGIREPGFDVQVRTILEHVESIHAFYGESMGVRIARKHISWYTKTINVTGREAFWRSVTEIERAKEQVRALAAFLHSQVVVPEAA